MKDYPFELTFSALREACIARANSQDWTPSDKIVSIVGEFGECANIIKKVRRGDFGLEDRPAEFKGCTVREAIAKELAATVTYIDHLAAKYDIDLGQAVFEKFNEISKRVGSPIGLVSPHSEDARCSVAQVCDERDLES